MRHVQKALIKYANSEKHPFIKINETEDTKGIPPTVSFTIQSDPIKEVGVNGIQAVDMLEYIKCLFESLNETFPCRENSLTITKIEEAIHWQEARTKNRIKRGVEGKNEL